MSNFVSDDRLGLTPEQLQLFWRNGYIGPFDLYEPEEMHRLWKQTRLKLLDRRKAVYQNQERAVSGVTNIANYDRHLDVEALAAHITKPEIVDKVCSVLGDDVLCWRTEFFPKYAGDEGTDWHQADTFANASGKPQIVWPENRTFGGTITVWTAFTPATIDTGCLQFIPGTHTVMNYDETKQMTYDSSRINAVEKDGIRRGFFGYDYRQLQIHEHWKPDESRAVSLEMRPGQFIIFWSTLMHASHPHSGRTRDARIGYVARYVPAHVLVYPDTNAIEEYGGTVSLERYGAVVVSGRPRANGNRIATHTTTGTPFTRRSGPESCGSSSTVG